MGLFGGLALNEVQELIEEVKKINKRLDKIEKKLKEQDEKNPQDLLKQFDEIYTHSINEIPDPCKACSNHPTNGGSGICHCTVPYFSGKNGVTYNV